MYPLTLNPTVSHKFDYTRLYSVSNQMFEARFANATLLKRILDAIKDLVQDVNLLCTEDGIELQSMDAAHVALINFTILAEACSLYTCDEQVTLGINVINLTKIIKCAEADDSVVLALSEDDLPR